MKLYLIRHGYTEGNKKHLYFGKTDLPLCEGEWDRLRDDADKYPKAERYYTSGMRRTEETLQAIYGDVVHEAVPGIAETDFGIFEMTSYEDVRDMPEYKKYISGDFFSNVPPGGESFVQVRDRTMRAMEKIIASGEDSVVVSHGGNIASMMRSWFPEIKSVYDCIPEPGQYVEIYLEDGRVTGHGEFI